MELYERATDLWNGETFCWACGKALEVWEEVRGYDPFLGLPKTVKYMRCPEKMPRHALYLASPLPPPPSVISRDTKRLLFHPGVVLAVVLAIIVIVAGVLDYMF